MTFTRMTRTTFYRYTIRELVETLLIFILYDPLRVFCRTFANNAKDIDIISSSSLFWLKAGPAPPLYFVCAYISLALYLLCSH